MPTRPTALEILNLQHGALLDTVTAAQGLVATRLLTIDTRGIEAVPLEIKAHRH